MTQFHPKQKAFMSTDKRMVFYNTPMIIKKESDLYPIIINEAKKSNWFLYRIEDAGSSKRPFDIGGISSNGKAVAIEVKIIDDLGNYTHDLTKFPLLKSHQIEWIRKFRYNGGLGLVIYYEKMCDWFIIYVCDEEKRVNYNIIDELENWPNHLKEIG